MIRISDVTRVADASGVAVARRAATQCAIALRMNENGIGRAALVATELATNVVKHGDGGCLLFGVDDARPHALAIVALDSGRGIANVAVAKQDGYSTAGSPGTGLGAVERACASLEIFSAANQGAASLCVVEDDVSVAPPRMRIGGVAIPKTGETENGDAWSAAVARDVVTIVVADGLGHGAQAATASSAAIRAIGERAHEPLEQLMQDAHRALRSTRGAAVSIARIHGELNRVDFLGIGNVAGTIVSDDSLRKMVSLPGIVGHEMRKLQTFSYPWSASSILVMQSDGVSAHWNLANYPGLMQHDPALIAAVLYRDFCRGTDDAAVVVAKAS